MEFVVVLAVAAVLGLVPASIARGKGRSFGAWWLYGWLLFLPALIHSAVIGNAADPSPAGGLRKCPYCAELVRDEAVVCRYCGRDLVPAAGSLGGHDAAADGTIRTWVTPQGDELTEREFGLLQASVAKGEDFAAVAQRAGLDLADAHEAVMPLLAMGFVGFDDEGELHATPEGSAAAETATDANESYDGEVDEEERDLPDLAEGPFFTAHSPWERSDGSAE